MEKPMTLCDRCEMQFSCLLNYDGVPCRKNRTVEPTNYDRIISKTPEELSIALCRCGCPPTAWDEHGVLDCPKPDEEACEEVCGSCWLDWLKQEATE